MKKGKNKNNDGENTTHRAKGWGTGTPLSMLWKKNSPCSTIGNETLDKPVRAIANGQSRDTCNIIHQLPSLIL